MNLLYEPYILSLLFALLFTFIYYLAKRNQPPPIEPEKKDKKQKSSMSPELRSILVFISSYSLFTGLFYIGKNIWTPDTTLLSVKENIEEIKDTILEKVEEVIPTMKVEQKNEVVEEMLVGGKKKSPHKDKDTLKYVNSKNAKFADHDIDFTLHAFDLK
jgi:hypothetical protein